MLFGAFYGFHFNSTALKSSDSYQHRLEFERMQNEASLGKYLIEELQNHGDIGIPLLRYSVSRFTGNVSIYFAVIGGVFMLLMGKSIVLLITEFYNQNAILIDHRIIALMLLYLFAFIYSLVTINAVRFPIATHAFILGCILTYLRQNKSGYLLIFASPLIHLAMWIAVGIFLVSILITRNIRFFVAISLAVISLFPSIASIQLSSVENRIRKSEVEAVSKRSNYLQENYISTAELGASKKNWYVNLRYDFIRLLLHLLSLYFLLKYKFYKIPFKYIDLLIYSVLLMSIGRLLADSMHSVGRFISVGNLLFIAWLLYSTGYTFISKISFRIPFYLAFSLFMIVEIRVFFYFTTVDVILSNPVLGIFYKSDIVMNQLIK